MPEKYKQRVEAVEEKKSSLAGILSRVFFRTNLWLILSIAFLILVILTCFGLWGYKESLADEKTDLENQLAQLNGQRDLELEADFAELKEGIEDLKKVLKNSVYPSRLFEMLEELTLSQVQFTSLDVDLTQAVLSLNAELIDYTTLAKQMIVFKEDERIEELDVSGISLDMTGQIKSAFDLELKLDFLRPQL